MYFVGKHSILDFLHQKIGSRTNCNFSYDHPPSIIFLIISADFISNPIYHLRHVRYIEKNVVCLYLNHLLELFESVHIFCLLYLQAQQISIGNQSLPPESRPKIALEIQHGRIAARFERYFLTEVKLSLIILHPAIKNAKK